MKPTPDRLILRDLAKRYLETCHAPQQQERRRLWRQHNSLKKTRPLIYARAFAWHEMPESVCQCSDQSLHPYEDFLRHRLFWDSLGDDAIFEPWVTVNAVYKCQGWGVDAQRHRTDDPGGSFKLDYPIKQLEDIEKLRPCWHEIDEAATQGRVAALEDAIGDIITINLDRGGAYRMWRCDLSTDLGFLRGIENFMLDMMDNPQWLHRLVGYMSENVLRTHQQAEAAGDWGLCAHQNQSMAYAQELPDPAPNVNGVRRKQLWVYMAAQEFTAVSPAMHEEFLLRYQLPILSQFGLSAYGCCEDLTHKIDMLRAIPNLRRIAVTPFANVRKCAEQIGTDYVLSYRPSPANMVSYGLDDKQVRRILREDLSACRQSHVDITLKDVETVQRDPQRVRNWVKLAREVVDEIF